MKILPALLALFSVSVLGVQQASPVASSEARQFDFWVGDWEVFSPDGKKAGENLIEKVAGGQGLLESWTGTGGYTGKSLNTWIAHKSRWQQFWVGADGALELSGGLNAAGEMVLSGRTPGSEGKATLNRITWTPKSDGTVRQHWEISTDEGGSWGTAFDGLYRRKNNPRS